MSHEILLKDILNGIKNDSLSQRRRKLRFNTSWTDSDTKIFRDFKSMYMDNDESFIPWILSIGSGKKKGLAKSIRYFSLLK